MTDHSYISNRIACPGMNECVGHGNEWVGHGNEWIAHKK
jgi:hypothetical protein